MGMANYNKNLFVGVGGSEGINESHFIGAAYGMERMMGRADTPLRRILNYAQEHFCRRLPLVFVLTVIGPEPEDRTIKKIIRDKGDNSGADIPVCPASNDFGGRQNVCPTVHPIMSKTWSGRARTVHRRRRGVFSPGGRALVEVNFTVLDEPPQKVVVYLDPEEFHSTWLGNKSIYRTRMAIADGGELVVLAPGVATFGEDREIDRLIRKYGYRTTPEIMRFVEQTDDLPKNLSAAAHLIHGSSEGRFSITYCPGKLSRAEIESVGYRYAELQPMLAATVPRKCAKAGTSCPTASGSTTSAIRPWGFGLAAAAGPRRKAPRRWPKRSGCRPRRASADGRP